MTTFCNYNLTRLTKNRKRPKSGKLNTLLGVAETPDVSLWDAILSSGVHFYVVTGEGYTLWLDSPAILDRVLKERAAWQ